MLHHGRTLDKLAHLENAKVPVPSSVTVQLRDRIRIAARHRKHVVEIETLHPEHGLFTIVIENIVEIGRGEKVSRRRRIAARTGYPFRAVFRDLGLFCPVEGRIGILERKGCLALKTFRQIATGHGSAAAHPIEMQSLAEIRQIFAILLQSFVMDLVVFLAGGHELILQLLPIGNLAGNLEEFPIAAIRTARPSAPEASYFASHAKTRNEVFGNRSHGSLEMAQKPLLRSFHGSRLESERKGMSLFKRRTDVDEIYFNRKPSAAAHKAYGPLCRIEAESARIVHEPAQAALLRTKPEVWNRLGGVHELSSARLAPKRKGIPHFPFSGRHRSSRIRTD